MENENITINDLAGIIKRSFDGVDKRFDGVDQKFDKVNQRFDGVDKRFDGVDQRMDTIDQKLIGVNQRLDKLAENQGVIMNKLENVVYQKEFDELKGRVEAIENALSTRSN